MKLLNPEILEMVDKSFIPKINTDFCMGALPIHIDDMIWIISGNILEGIPHAARTHIYIFWQNQNKRFGVKYQRKDFITNTMNPSMLVFRGVFKKQSFVRPLFPHHYLFDDTFPRKAETSSVVLRPNVQKFNLNTNWDNILWTSFHGLKNPFQ